MDIVRGSAQVQWDVTLEGQLIGGIGSGHCMPLPVE